MRPFVSFRFPFILVFILGNPYLVSSSRLPSVIGFMNGLIFNQSDSSRVGSEDSENVFSKTPSYYTLTDHGVFNIEGDILSKALHIGSDEDLHSYELGITSDARSQSNVFRVGSQMKTQDDVLVVVPSSYEPIIEREILDIVDDIDEHFEGKDGKEDDENNDYSEHIVKARGQDQFLLPVGNYSQLLLGSKPNLLENTKQSLYFENIADARSMEPLFLTAYAFSSNFLDGQKLAAVKPFVGNIRSYSGYLTVDKRFHSNLFFWYFPCERPDWQKRPVLLWLQGGPGASSLFATFYENGPYKLVNGKIVRNEYTWTREYNVLYIDNPVGSGFSFTAGGYARNQTIIGQHLYEALFQFFHLFPEVSDNDFYITGESYAGKYIPSVAFEIHQRNLLSHFKINLKGLFIGNGLIDPVSMMEYSQYLFHIGLLDEEQRDIVATLEDKVRLLVRTKQWKRAANLYEDFFFSSRAYKSQNNFLKMTGFRQHYNLNGLDFSTKDFNLFLNDVTVRQRLHVGRMKFNSGVAVGEALQADIMKSVLDKVNILVENYRIVFYYGQLDIICPYRLSEAFFHNIQFRGAFDYHKAERQIWTYERQDDQDNVVGYIKEAHNLVEVLIRNAGHMVPHDQPRFMMDLLRKYIC